MLNLPADVKKNVTYISALGFFLSLVTIISNNLSDTLLISNLGANKLPYAKFSILSFSFLISLLFFKSMESLKSAILMKSATCISAAFLASYYIILEAGLSFLTYYIYATSYIIYIYYFLFYYIVIPDYFLLRFEKKCMPIFFGAVAIGGIFGALFCTQLLKHFSIAQIYGLNSFIALIAAYICHILYKNCRVIENSSEETSEFAGSLIKTLKFSPKLFKNYSVSKLMAIGVVLIEFVTCIAEYLTFSIYQKVHPDQIKLASFLAKISLFQSLAQFLCATVLAYYMANRMSPVARNLVYPTLALASSILFVISPGIGSAIFGSFVIRTFYDTINCTSSNINYKAINSRYANIAYILNASIISPSAIACVSASILFMQNHLTFSQISFVLFFISILFITVHFKLGKEYFIGISANIQEFYGNKNFITENKNINIKQIREKLTSESTNGVAYGLSLSESFDLSLIEEEIKDLLTSRHIPIWRECILFLQKKEIESFTSNWIKDSNERLVMSSLTLSLLRNKMTEDIRLIAQKKWRDSTDIQTILFLINYNSTYDSEINNLNMELILQNIDLFSNEHPYSSLLHSIIQQNMHSPFVRSKAIRLLADSKKDALENSYVFELLQSKDDVVRAAACYYVGKKNCKELLPFMVTLMADPSSLVREEVEIASSLFSDQAINIVVPYLNSRSKSLQQKTIATLGAIGTTKATKALSLFVEEKHQHSITFCRYKNLLPNKPEWLPLKIAIEDGIKNIVIFTFELLSSFGYQKTIRKIEMAFYSQNLVIRENALEALASLPHQFLIKPLSPILNNHPNTQNQIVNLPQQITMLHEIALTSENWIRIGALSVLKNLNCPITIYEENALKEIERMSIVTLLKSVPLFSELNLDDLSEIESQAKYQTFIAEDIIFKKDDIGRELFIIIEGEIDIVYEGRILATLKSGKYFGEMALLENGTRSADAIVRTNCKLLCIYQHVFIQYAMKNPTILLDLCRSMSKTINSLNAKISVSK